MVNRQTTFQILLWAGFACLAAGCTELTVQERSQLGLPLHMQLITSSTGTTTAKLGTDPVIMNTLFDLLQKSEEISPDISKIKDTPFGEVLSIGSPAGYTLRNRYLHPGVPLAEALAQNPDPAMRERLIERARWDRSDEVRSTALIALAQMRDERDHSIFQEASAHLNPAVRFGAIEALSVWGHPRKATPILKAAAENDAQPLLRAFAAAGMARLNDPEGLIKLRQFVDHSDWIVRAMAVRYIGDFGEKQDYDLLIDRLSREEGNDFVMAEYCIAALKLFAKQET